MGSGVCYGDVNEWKLCDIYRSVWEVGYVYGSVACVWVPAETSRGSRTPRAGVIGDCEAAYMGAGNQTFLMTELTRWTRY